VQERVLGAQAVSVSGPDGKVRRETSKAIWRDANCNETGCLHVFGEKNVPLGRKTRAKTMTDQKRKKKKKGGVLKKAPE